jgi:hypothetical protein
MDFSVNGTRTLSVLATSTNPTIKTVTNTPLIFGTNDTERMRIDSSGNVGLGVTPSAWGSSFDAIQVGAGSALWGETGLPTGTYLSSNLYYNGTNRIYIGGTYKPAEYSLYNGIHTWSSAAAGTAGTTITLTPLMTLDASGTLLVGKTTAVDTTVGAVMQATGRLAGTMAASTNAQDTLTVYSTGAGAYRFYVGMGGTVYATSTTISSLSDLRFKENVRELDAGIAEVMALKPRLYDWKEGKGANIKNARGFIAQEFETVFPDLIDEWRDPAPEGEAPYKAVRQDLFPVLVKAIQEQQAMIEELKAEIELLKGVK